MIHSFKLSSWTLSLKVTILSLIGLMLKGHSPERMSKLPFKFPHLKQWIKMRCLYITQAVPLKVARLHA